jgi:mRNA interferase RelE/StbE
VYRIEFRPAAARQFRKLPRQAQRRIDAALRLLQDSPRPPKAEALKGALRGYLRIRTGDYRVVYCVEDDRLVICVVRVAHRRDVYR